MGTLRGRVLDQFDAVVGGATVTVISASGAEKTADTNEQGEYLVSGLAPGKYTVRTKALHFAPFEETEVEIIAGRNTRDIKLSVALEKQEEVLIDSATGNGLSTAPDSNAGAVVLTGPDLEVLPDDSDDLAGALRAMAGPVAGPSGVQFSVDGFTNTGQPLPPRETIREVRINQNPFSAENDRLGFGLIQIFTRPGTDKLRGEGFFGFSDESLNSRNPFAENRAPFQTRQYGITLSGPIVPKKASFFVSFNRRELDENEVVNATILDSAFVPTPLRLAVLTPGRRTSFNPRFDYQPNINHTLSVRYSYFLSSTDNFGVGGFSLPERGIKTHFAIHTFQFTETAVVNPSIVNELRAQYIRENRIDEGRNDIPTLNVQEAFVSGAPQLGPSSNPESRWWLQDNLTWIKGNHTVRSGARLRHSAITDISPDNFGGTYTFAGGIGPQLNAQNQPVLDPAGQFIPVPLTSLERYRRTLVFQEAGLTPARIRQLGGGASQFSIAGGNPLSEVRQVDFGAFIQDDWRYRPNLTLSFGLRYEFQTNIRKTLNFAPRVAFAWSPATQANVPPKTVVRGGFGIFYDRVDEGLVEVANRFNGLNQQLVITSDPAVLDLFPVVPPVESLSGAANFPTTTIRIAPELRVPYTMQGALSIERQLPYKTTVAVNFVSTRTLHLLRSRNINSPLPRQPAGGLRPFPDLGNLFEYESSGRLNQNQLIVSVNNRLSTKFTIFANYTLNKANSDTEGVGTFPANTYDLSTEYGRSSADVRHFFFLGGSIQAPFGLRFNPLIVAFSGRPFNITTGRDTNGDTLFTERPAFATDLTKPGIVFTPFGAFDPNPAPGQQLIPRNYGNGPAFFSVNLNVSRAYSFGNVPGQAAAKAGSSPAKRTTEKRYTMTFSLRVQNLLNHTNPGQPIGNLSSLLFGRANTTAGNFGFNSGIPAAGNRRIEGQIRFSF
jgi:hypothetical protein